MAVHVVHTKEYPGADILRVFGWLDHITAPNVDGHGRLVRDHDQGLPVVCGHCLPARLASSTDDDELRDYAHIHPTVFADGSISATTNHFDSEHFHHAPATRWHMCAEVPDHQSCELNGKPEDGEPGGQHREACSCKARAMTDEEREAYSMFLLLERYPGERA